MKYFVFIVLLAVTAIYAQNDDSTTSSSSTTTVTISTTNSDHECKKVGAKVNNFKRELKKSVDSIKKITSQIRWFIFPAVIRCAKTIDKYVADEGIEINKKLDKAAEICDIGQFQLTFGKDLKDFIYGTPECQSPLVGPFITKLFDAIRFVAGSTPL